MSRTVLLDTDIFSFIFKRDSRAALYEDALRGTTPSLCFMSVAELRHWSFARRWGEARRQELERAMRRTRILLPDDRTTTLWAEITTARRAGGKPISCGDCWIAATALRHNIPLLTHNASDYVGVTGLIVVTRA